MGRFVLSGSQNYLLMEGVSQSLSGRVGQVVNFSSLANDLGIDHKTAKAWLSVLQAGYIVFLLGPHHRGMEPDAWFFRDSTGNEVDLIIERADDVRAVEIKAGSTVSRDSFRGLERYRTWSGLPPDHAYLIYSGDESMQRKAARLLSWRDLPVLLDTDRTRRRSG